MKKRNISYRLGSDDTTLGAQLNWHPSREGNGVWLVLSRYWTDWDVTTLATSQSTKLLSQIQCSAFQGPWTSVITIH